MDEKKAEKERTPGTDSDVSDQGEPEETSSSVFPPQLSANSSLRTAIGGFEVYMAQEGFSEHTVKAFLSDLNILMEFLGVGTAIGSISTDDLNRFTKWLVGERNAPCNPKSLARRVTTLKVFFGWLDEAEVLSKDPSAAVVHKPVITPLSTILSDAEIERALEVTEGMREAEKPDARPHLLFTLLLHTGIKKGECANIVLNHLDLQDPAQPIVWIRYANPRRRHKERKLILPGWWTDVLREYREQYQPKEKLFPCTPRNLEYVLDGVAEQAELPNGISFEMLRWTCALRDYKAGMKAVELRQKLGISKVTWRGVKQKLGKLANLS